ncbi:MAG TPA: tol-pal system-associated acyl-CoA thioesterase [Nevskiales bacterium]|nr:tol-pal system-associated acyl-CoA thioesterase [Nevskiales bacterium]
MQYPVRVYYEDTDASGVAYHANYLRWFERARTEWLRGLGFGQERLLREAGIGFTVASLSVRYLRPARLDDELIVRTQVLAVGKASIRFEQHIHYAGAEPGAALAMASVRVGCVGVGDFRPRRMPDAIEQALMKELGHVG